MLKNLFVILQGDIDDIVYLSLETVLNGFSVLIFCSSRGLVETVAKKISASFYNIGCDTNSSQYAGVVQKLRNCLDSSRIATVVEQLRQCPGGSDKVLSRAVMFGVGYHHAGLTYENRDIVESAFKRGILKVCFIIYFLKLNNHFAVWLFWFFRITLLFCLSGTYTGDCRNVYIICWGKFAGKTRYDSFSYVRWRDSRHYGVSSNVR